MSAAHLIGLGIGEGLVVFVALTAWICRRREA
jgi:hypothetical protein